MRCRDFVDAEEGMLPAECCESCHEDSYGGYVPLEEYTNADADVIPEGRVAALCCRIAKKIGTK